MSRSSPGAAPGPYRGTIAVHADGITPIELALRVKVWPYEIPRKWNFHTLAKSAEVRIARQTALRRRMLHDRHVRACAALKVKPLSAEKWNALWPKRTSSDKAALGDR